MARRFFTFELCFDAWENSRLNRQRFWEDNAFCIFWSTNPENAEHSRHVDTRKYFLRDLVRSGVVVLTKVGTRNVADALTKSLSATCSCFPSASGVRVGVECPVQRLVGTPLGLERYRLLQNRTRRLERAAWQDSIALPLGLIELATGIHLGGSFLGVLYDSFLLLRDGL